ncbi:MAG: hypothetical protein AB7S71_07735 [Dongiaceae bacterium]
MASVERHEQVDAAPPMGRVADMLDRVDVEEGDDLVGRCKLQRFSTRPIASCSRSSLTNAQKRHGRKRP